MFSCLGEAGQNHNITRQRPAKYGAECGIRDGIDDAGAAEPRAQADTSRRSPGRPMKLWRIFVRL
jgi:hypothetical protein